jgi:hypothetical protein
MTHAKAPRRKEEISVIPFAVFAALRAIKPAAPAIWVPLIAKHCSQGSGHRTVPDGRDARTTLTGMPPKKRSRHRKQVGRALPDAREICSGRPPVAAVRSEPRP